MNILIKPLITEKSISQGAGSRYVFVVAPNAVKREIAQAVAKQYNVKVSAVNIVRLPVKVKRFKGRVGTRSPIKKAYVTLQPGQHIALFEENTSEKKS